MKDKTLFYFACNDARLMMTLVRAGGEYFVMFEINGIEQDQMLFKGGLGECLEHFEAVQKETILSHMEEFAS